MKTLYKSIVYIVLVLSPMLFSRCALSEDITKIQDSLDSLKIIVGTPEFKSLVHLEFVDAKTKKYITDVVSVTVTGKNASVIYSNLGQQSAAPASYSSIVGMLDLVADPHQVDTATLKTKPIEFDVTTSLAGYANITQSVSIYENKFKTVIIPLIDLQNPPDGVTVNQQDHFALSDVNGALISPAIAALNSGAQTVEIPQGVILKDASGNPISGTVSSRIIFYNPTTEDAQNAIPGGLDVTAKLADGSSEHVSFVSAGMFGISLTAGDKEVKSFTGDSLKIMTEVDPGLINPNTGDPIKAGDVIEMWSKEVGSGNWIFDKMSTVKAVNGKLVLEEKVGHLSYWNWDYHCSSCYYGPTFIWKGSISNYVVVKVTAKFQNCSTTYITNAIPNNFYDGNLQILRPPKNTPTEITFTDAANSNKPIYTFSPSKLNIADLCDEKTYDITITEDLSNKIIVNIDLSLSSSSSTVVKIKPNATIYISPTNEYNWTDVSLKNGETSLNVLIGEEYTILGMFGNVYGFASLKVEDNGNNSLKITITPIVYFESTPQSNIKVSTVVPKPTNNIVSVKYNIVLPPDVFNLLH